MRIGSGQTASTCARSMLSMCEGVTWIQAAKDRTLLTNFLRLPTTPLPTLGESGLGSDPKVMLYSENKKTRRPQIVS